MKKVIVTTLTLGSLLLLVALVLAFMDWEIATPMMLGGLLADLIALAAYLAYRFQVWQEHPRRKASVLVLVWGSLLVVAGAVFKVVGWPWAEQILIGGVAIELVALMAYFTVKQSSN